MWVNISKAAKEVNGGFIVLVFLALFSALAVIYVIQCNRYAYDQLLKTKIEKNKITDRWNCLQLEYSSLVSLERIENIASKDFEMVAPSRNNFVIIKP